MQKKVIQGAVVLLDLDHFKEIQKKMGWPRYSPNIVTGSLTGLVEQLIRKHHGMLIWGLNETEGTEEAMLIFTFPDTEELERDLAYIREEIYKIGQQTGCEATLSIGIGIGPLSDLKLPKSRRSKDLYSTPTRKLAKKAINIAKKKGGNQIIILTI